ncbi:nucleolar MIF4G domain-containing protein 1 homolog [Spodoptera frugiperda]|uniref:Nucleolar MIF4G domain-containing protein 1 homolog n=1 Tax=Spodoptera frugiperda TaxID=7108 RepID=A0A9R0EM47_SPOFR|nr:nucleolar MIF4G domain-containing protein 1 homolog [Spodoptera frugiperda]
MSKMKKNKSNAKPQFENTRKALRKQKRLQKKVHRQEHYLKKNVEKQQPVYTAGRFVKRPAESPEPKVEVKKKKPKLETPLDILNKERQKEKNVEKKLKNEMEEQRKRMLQQANEEEDKIIKKLEKQLGLNKTKNKNSYFADDGLDYLLELCDKSTTEQIVAAEKHLAEVEGDSDFEEDLAAVTGKEIKDKKKNKKKDKKVSNDSEEDFGSDDEMGSGEEFDEDLSGEEEDGDMSEGDGDMNEEDGDGSEGDEYMSEGDGEMSEGDGEMSEGDEDMIEGDSEEENGYSTDDAPEEKPTKTSKAKKQKLANQKEEKKAAADTKTNKQSNKKEKIVKEEDLSKVFSDDEISHLSGDDDDDDEDLDEEAPVVEKKEKPDIWEDIYGRKRDKEGNIIKEEKGVYIPPHLRNKDSSSDKQLLQLKRQIKSILNKLAGTNLHWACTSIENLYQCNSRNSVNTALTQLWLDATVSPAATPDRMLAEHAALVSVLHANVGSEIGAHFLQELSKRFDDMMQSPQPVSDKTLDNLVACLAHLYSFKIYHATLLYDILTRLLDSISEKNIECVLVALRCVGGVLRKEEPLALKNFIHDTQGRVAKLNEASAAGSRIKFLLEVLMAVKNNNLTKIPNYEPTYAEHLKKMTRTIIRKGNYITPLNIRLEDLLKADERGKWWVVGSAWEGNRPRPEEKPSNKAVPTADQKLLELARQQRMNTDVRRSIFCVIMSAEDYMDAFEKLQHLGLKGQQEREIVHVLLACCLQEKTYNPYYAVLGQKLCDTDRKYQLSIQFSVWDKIKELDSISKQSTTNLAQFLIHLIMEKGLALSVLKVIQFSELNKHTVRFMRQILLSIIMNADFQSSLEVFHRISKPPKLHLFRESIRLFIQHFLIKNAGKKSEVLSAEELVTLKERAQEVDKILTLHESKLKF